MLTMPPMATSKLPRKGKRRRKATPARGIKIATPAVQISATMRRKIKKAFESVAREDAEAAAFMGTFRSFVRTQYGPRCKKPAVGCICCQMWALYDLTNTFVI